MDKTKTIYVNPEFEKIKKLVFESLGQASMCWSEMPKGIFDSNLATQIGEDLCAVIFTALQPKPGVTAKQWLSKKYPGLALNWGNTGHDGEFMVRMMEEYANQFKR